MKHPIINFDEFDLPFSSLSPEMVEDEELSAYEVKDNMETNIPKEAIFIGNIDSEVGNWTSWIVKDEYYIIPLNDEKYNWALFRISWDDNWETWNWSFDARLNGYSSDYRKAAKYVLLKLWEKWDFDLNDKVNQPYIDLLNGV
jgi:hypothetical protein